MSEAYDQAVETNKLVVGYCLGFQQTEDWRYVYGVHKLIEPTSKQVIDAVIAKAGLSPDLGQDMLQDAYLRLPYAILGWEYDRVPVFVSYWRRVLHNFLVQEYGKFWRHRDLPDKVEKIGCENSEAKSILEEIRAKLTAEVEGWMEEKDARNKKLVLMLIEKRVFVLKEDQASQKSIAEELGIAGGIVSAWESWLRQKIKDEYS